MAEAAPYNADIMAWIETFTDSSVAHAIATTTPEQTAASEAIMASMKNDPEARTRILQEVTDDWNAADADSDGLLNRAEFVVFH